MGVFFPFNLGVKPLHLCFHLSHDDLDFNVFSENEVYHRHMHTKNSPLSKARGLETLLKLLFTTHTMYNNNLLLPAEQTSFSPWI